MRGALVFRSMMGRGLLRLSEKGSWFESIPMPQWFPEWPVAF